MAKKPASAKASPAPVAVKSTTTAKRAPATPTQQTTVVSTTTTPTSPSSPKASTTTSTSAAPPALSSRAYSSPQTIALYVVNRYLHETPSRTLLLDVFLLFLVLVGGVQFAYCVIAGNFPFNAFLAGFSAAAGQFVLTISLRLQTSERAPPGVSTKKPAAAAAAVNGGDEYDAGAVSKFSSERAFADFVLGSLILHAFCVNFIN